MLNLKYLLVLSLLCSCLATADINKNLVLNKLQNYIDDSILFVSSFSNEKKGKFDGSTFMEIEALVNSSVDKFFQETNEITTATPAASTTAQATQRSKTRFTPDTFSNNLAVTTGCSGDTIQADSNVEVSNMLNTTFFNTENLNLQDLYLTSLYNPHNPIVVRGNFKMNTVSVNQPVQATSFLVKDVQQWTLLKQESFHHDEKVEGWSLSQINSCEGSQLKDGFLGGPCVLNTDVTKKIENLPSHKKLRIKATLHLFDNWEGETIFLQMDGGKTVWSKKGTVNKKFETTNRCGNPEYGDPLMNINIDKIIDHEDSFLSLRFSTNMIKDVCKASYAIEDFSLYFQ